MFEIEHRSNLAKITGRPGLSWSVWKTLYINHIKDIADEQISNADRKLAALEKVLTWHWLWRHSNIYLLLQMAVGHANILPTMPVTFPGLQNHHQQHSSSSKHHQDIELVAIGPTLKFLAWLETTMTSPRSCSNTFCTYLPSVKMHGIVQIA